jgi:hypothetical protein
MEPLLQLLLAPPHKLEFCRVPAGLPIDLLEASLSLLLTASLWGIFPLLYHFAKLGFVGPFINLKFNISEFHLVS